MERWFVISYDSTAKAYKRATIKEDIAEFLLLLKIGTRDLKIRKIESYTDSTIHFALETKNAIKDYKDILNAIETHGQLKIVAFSLNLISINKDTEEQLFYFIPKQPLKNDFDKDVATIKKENNIK